MLRGLTMILGLAISVSLAANEPLAASTFQGSNRVAEQVVPQLRNLPPQPNLQVVESILGTANLRGKPPYSVSLYYLTDGSKIVVACTKADAVVWVLRRLADRTFEQIFENPNVRPEGWESSMPTEALDQADLLEERGDAAKLETMMKDAKELTLMSIAPDSRYEKRGANVEVMRVTKMEGAWTVSGKAVLKRPSDIAKLASSFREGIEHNEKWSAACFRPRHAVRFRHNDDEVELLICFECLVCYVEGLGQRKYFHLPWNGTAEKIWTTIYREAGLTLQVDPPGRIQN